MLTITALVKELRKRTGISMMECKKRLIETNGDIEAAIELMRKSGQAKAAKKIGRITAEGLIITGISKNSKSAVMIEINCETDFVAKDKNFSSFSSAVIKKALNSEVKDIKSLIQQPIQDSQEMSIEKAREMLVAKVGENISIRRFIRLESQGSISSYCHNNRIGVIADMKGASEELGHNIAMHIAASDPICISKNDIDIALINKEREIYREEVQHNGKPENLINKIVEGKIKKYIEQVTLLGQTFIKDPNLRISQLLEKEHAYVTSFYRFELGENIKKI